MSKSPFVVFASLSRLHLACISIIFTELPAFSDDSMHLLLCRKIPRTKIDHHFNRTTTTRIMEKRDLSETTKRHTNVRLGGFYDKNTEVSYIRRIISPGIHYLLTWLCAVWIVAHSNVLWVCRTNVFLLSCYIWRPTELIRDALITERARSRTRFDS